MEMSTGIGSLAAALSKAQKTMKGAAKDSTNPHFKSKYADLASVWDAARDALTGNGLSVVQGASADGTSVTVTTLLLHDSGEWVKDSLTAQARDAGPQSVGSCITYGRRYGLAAMVGIAPEDDDAESATRNTTPHVAAVVPPLPRVTGPSVPNGGDIGTPSTLAADMNAAVSQGYKAGLKTANSFRAPVRNKVEPSAAKPMTDVDIPFDTGRS